MNNVVSQIVVVATAIIGLAIVATLVSRNAQTGQVIREAGNAFTGAIRAATGPVTGAGAGYNTNVGFANL
jgi:hypothetical protein